MGKTQVCLQLCCSAQLPNSSASADMIGFSKCLFLDTEGAFNAKRLQEMAEGTREAAVQQLKSQGKERLDYYYNFVKFKY